LHYKKKLLISFYSHQAREHLHFDLLLISVLVFSLHEVSEKLLGCALVTGCTPLSHRKV